MNIQINMNQKKNATIAQSTLPKLQSAIIPPPPSQSAFRRARSAHGHRVQHPEVRGRHPAGESPGVIRRPMSVTTASRGPEPGGAARKYEHSVNDRGHRAGIGTRRIAGAGDGDLGRA
jgi:hypothetical protein